MQSSIPTCGREKHWRPGASLLELILFIGITTMMTGVIVSFSLLSTQMGFREEIVAAVEQSGSFAADVITRKVNAAQSVTATPTQLTLTMSDPSLNPTVIELDGGKIRITEGFSTSYLTPGSVAVENLNFVLLGATETSKRGVTVSFSVASKAAPDAAAVFDYAKQFRTTVAGR